MALSILIAVNIIGTAVGFLIPPLFVSDPDTNSNIVQDQFFNLQIFEFGIAALSTILILIFFKEGPPTLPSLGAMVENVSYKESFKILFTDKRFLGLAFAFATVNGNFNIYGSLMDDILDPY